MAGAGTSGIGPAWKGGAPALRTRTLRPSRSSSNSARSWSRTSARIRSISEKAIDLRLLPRQHFAPVAGDEHVVVDPHPADPRQVGARLGGDGHTRLEPR